MAMFPFCLSLLKAFIELESSFASQCLALPFGPGSQLLVYAFTTLPRQMVAIFMLIDSYLATDLLFFLCFKHTQTFTNTHT